MLYLSMDTHERSARLRSDDRAVNQEVEEAARASGIETDIAGISNSRGEVSPSTFRRLLYAFLRAVTWWLRVAIRRYRVKKTIRQLQAVPPHLLKDIGINRQDIPEAAMKADKKNHPESYR